MESKYELSLKVAEPLAQLVQSQPFGTVVVASGTSCRHQIEHLAPGGQVLNVEKIKSLDTPAS